MLCLSSNPQPLVIHPWRSLPWLPALSASLFNGAVYDASIARATLQDTWCATVKMVAVQWMFLCLELARVIESAPQHCWHPIPATPFRWQQLPALEPLDPSVPLLLKKHYHLKVRHHNTKSCNAGCFCRNTILIFLWVWVSASGYIILIITNCGEVALPTRPLGNYCWRCCEKLHVVLQGTQYVLALW